MRALGLLGLSVVAVGALGLATAASATVNDPPLWNSVQSAGGLILDDAVGAGVLGTGAPVVAGTFLGPAYFPTGPAPDDSITLPGAGFTSVFVATLDSAGTYFTWAQRAYGADASVSSTVVMGSATATIEDDTIMIMGTYTNGTLYFPTGVGDDSTALPHLGINPDAYIAALRPGGGFAWAQRLGPATAIGDSFQPWGLSVSASGAPLVTGALQGTVDFPGSSGPVSMTSTGNPWSAVVGEMSADDSGFAWIQLTGGTATVLEARSVVESNAGTATPGDDHLIVSGLLGDGTAYFPTGRPAPDDSIAVITGPDAGTFIAAMNTDDTYFTWVRWAGDVAGTGGFDIVDPVSLAAGPDGSAYVSGSLTGPSNFPLGPDDSVTITPVGLRDAYVAQVAADDSYFTWVTGFGGAGNDSATAVGVTASGMPIVSGQFRGPMDVPAADGVITVPAGLGSVSVFIGAMESGAPAFTWIQTAGPSANSGSVRSKAMAIMIEDAALVVGNFFGTANFATASGTASVTSRGSGDVFAAMMNLPVPAPPTTPSEPVRSSPPTDVSAIAGDRSARITWRPPVSTGSFAVTHYLVHSSPGKGLCLAAAPSHTCEVTGLANRTAYTFTVKALTGAGWSPASVPSNAVTPRATARPTIVITGARDGKRVKVTGRATGIEAGVLLTPHSARGLGAFVAGVPFALGPDGSVAWGRRASDAVVWRVYVGVPGVRSNTVTIR